MILRMQHDFTTHIDHMMVVHDLGLAATLLGKQRTFTHRCRVGSVGVASNSARKSCAVTGIVSARITPIKAV